MRAIQGLGAGGMNVCVNVIIVDLVPRRERAKWSGIVSLSGALGLLAGVLSGSATAQTSWRIIFYINIGIAVVAITLTVFFLQLPPVQGDKLNRLKTADWSGMVILSGSIAGLIFAVISGGSLYPWSSARIIAPLAIGGVGILVFALFENHVARKGLRQPFIPLRLFSSRTAASGYLMTFLHGMVLWAVPYYFLYFIHVCASRSLVESSILSLPAVLIVAPSAAVAGIAMSRLSHFKYFNVAGFILMAGGCIGLSTLRAKPTTGQIVAYQFFISIGGGILFPGRIVSVQAAQRRMANDDEVEVRLATSLVSFATSLGQAFGIAMGSTALQNAWDPMVRKALAAGKIDGQHVILGSQAAKATEIISKLPPAMKEAYQDIAARSVARIEVVNASANEETNSD
ncbi:hypothetical protein NQ176_g10672 [Zarea fungicola]|uniref:Uncharacterized protein n=1 Tax=Zarea fungicola TaxID=93591 RepID=A0ACC1MEV0_9HYPO|nr:hypothetical protein NQ176_g10672 [Lecanicillium fungicola]